MTTIIIKPKSKSETSFLSRLFRKMNIDARIVEEKIPNEETIKAINDVEERKGIRVKDSNELFGQLGI
nr:hypothetical protein [Bacteroidota bacterium]